MTFSIPGWHAFLSSFIQLNGLIPDVFSILLHTFPPNPASVFILFVSLEVQIKFEHGLAAQHEGLAEFRMLITVKNKIK